MPPKTYLASSQDPHAQVVQMLKNEALSGSQDSFESLRTMANSGNQFARLAVAELTNQQLYQAQIPNAKPGEYHRAGSGASSVSYRVEAVQPSPLPGHSTAILSRHVPLYPNLDDPKARAFAETQAETEAQTEGNGADAVLLEGEDITQRILSALDEANKVAREHRMAALQRHAQNEY